MVKETSVSTESFGDRCGRQVAGCFPLHARTMLTLVVHGYTHISVQPAHRPPLTDLSDKGATEIDFQQHAKIRHA
jgi:hypothetical protein